MNQDYKKRLFCDKGSIRDALDQINKCSGGALFIVNDKEQLCGVLTDGDIRRALLRKSTLDSSVKGALHPDYKYVHQGELTPEYLASLEDKISYLPVVDDNKKVVDCYFFEYRLPIPIAQPLFGGNEAKYVNECLATNWISSQGKFVREFEKRFSSFCGTQYGVATCNGTAALHLALAARGIGPGDEVIVPSLTFIATANAVVFTGAKPVFVDSSLETWGMDPEDVKQKLTSRTKAIIPVHLYGSPVDMDPIMELARENGVFVLEDAAEAHGAKYKGKPVGGIGHAGCFSFYGNKIITTGEGGMVVTDDKALADKMCVLRDHGMDQNRKYWHPYIGYNYRMTNLQAAIGCAQLENIDLILQDKKRIEESYLQRLEGVEGLGFQKKNDFSQSVNWMFSVLLEERKNGPSRDEVIRFLEQQHIEARPFFYPAHMMPPYREKEEIKLANAEFLSRMGINLPSFIGISEEEIGRVCRSIRKILA